LKNLTNIKANAELQHHLHIGNVGVKTQSTATGQVIREENFDPGGGTKPVKGENYKTQPSGFHNRNNLNPAKVKELTSTTITLATGETAYKSTISFRLQNMDVYSQGKFVSEGWVKKAENTTFFPMDWDNTKISEVIAEAFTNAHKNNAFIGNKWIGTTLSGIAIEGFRCKP
jgi:Bacterial EndoU nuclease